MITTHLGSSSHSKTTKTHEVTKKPKFVKRRHSDEPPKEPDPKTKIINSNTSRDLFWIIKKHLNDTAQITTNHFTLLNHALLSQQPPIIYNSTDPRRTEQMNKNRIRLFNWILLVHSHFKLFPRTFFVAVAIFDKFTSQTRVPTKELQLVGITCFFIASKIEDIYVPSIKKMSDLCNGSAKVNEILEKEREIASTIEFKVNVVTTHTYLTAFSGSLVPVFLEAAVVVENITGRVKAFLQNERSVCVGSSSEEKCFEGDVEKKVFFENKNNNSELINENYLVGDLKKEKNNYFLSEINLNTKNSGNSYLGFKSCVPMQNQINSSEKLTNKSSPSLGIRELDFNSKSSSVCQAKGITKQGQINLLEIPALEMALGRSYESSGKEEVFKSLRMKLGHLINFLGEMSVIDPTLVLTDPFRLSLCSVFLSLKIFAKIIGVDLLIIKPIIFKCFYSYFSFFNSEIPVIKNILNLKCVEGWESFLNFQCKLEELEKVLLGNWKNNKDYSVFKKYSPECKGEVSGWIQEYFEKRNS